MTGTVESEGSRGGEQVDWMAVERRGRLVNCVAPVIVLAFFGSLVLLTGRYAFWEGRAAWVAVAVLATLALAGLLLGLVRPRARARAAEGYRMQHALRHRIDPGAALRRKVDANARYMAGMRWAAWVMPMAPLSFLLTARWDRPRFDVPAAAIVVGATGALVLWWLRQSAAARRWVADPPGPPREAPPMRWAERWMSGRRLLWFVLALFLLSTVLGLVAAVLGD